MARAIHSAGRRAGQGGAGRAGAGVHRTARSPFPVSSENRNTEIKLVSTCTHFPSRSACTASLPICPLPCYTPAHKANSGLMPPSEAHQLHWPEKGCFFSASPPSAWGLSGKRHSTCSRDSPQVWKIAPSFGSLIINHIDSIVQQVFALCPRGRGP